MGGYVPYTATKDYFEEPNTGGDLVLLLDTSNGALEVSCIEETQLLTLRLIPPSSRIGVQYGKFMDLVKIYVSASQSTGDTISLFSDENSPFFNVMQNQIFTRIKNLTAAAGLPSAATGIVAGKVLRIDYLPESTGKFGGAVITLMFYI
jgi:hypothetical protein